MQMALGSSPCRWLHARYTWALCAIIAMLLAPPAVTSSVSSDPGSDETAAQFCVRWASGDSVTSKYYCDVNKDIGVSCDPTVKYDSVQRAKCAAGEVKLRYSSEFTNPMELRCYEQCFPPAAGETPGAGTNQANGTTSGVPHSCRGPSSLYGLGASLLLLLLSVGLHMCCI
jgi:hypothetical protein